MKSIKPQVLMIIAFGALTVLGYQNCQQGGSTLNPLASLDCSFGSTCKNQQLLDADRITVQINDTNGVRIISRDTTSQLVTGSCNPGGADEAKVNVTLQRIGASSPAPETRSVNCNNKSWSATFTRVQEFATAFNYSDLMVTAAVSAFDEYGDLVVPTYSGNGLDTSILRFQGSLPDPTPTPGPNGTTTLSIVNFRAAPAPNANWLVVDTYIWPAPTPPITLTMTANYQGIPSQNTIIKTISGLYPSANGQYYFPFSFAPGPGEGNDTNVPANTNMLTRSYEFTVSLGTSATVYDRAVHRPFPNPFPIGGFTKQCITTAANGFPARSLALRFNLIPQGSLTSFPLEYEYRSLTANTKWSDPKPTASITLDGDNGAVINIRESQYPNAYKELMLIRIYYNGAMQTFVSDCRPSY